MRIYVASHCKWAARYVAGELRALGATVISTWHDGEFRPTAEQSVEERRAAATTDLDQVMSADGLVIISGGSKYSGGKFVEAGIAMGRGIPVVVLGERENMLLWHPSVRARRTVKDVWDELLGPFE